MWRPETPELERALQAAARDPVLVLPAKWKKIDRALARLIFGRIVDRRTVSPGDNVPALLATGGRLPAPVMQSSTLVNPRGVADLIPDRLRQRMAPRPKPDACEVCGDAGTICFEHDHKTGHFRGWLCSNCNSALGLAKDSPQRLRMLADYLDAHERAVANVPPMPERLPRFITSRYPRPRRKPRSTQAPV